MTPPAVVSQAAEDSCRLINQTLAAHEVCAGALVSSRNRPRIRGEFDGEQVERQATLLRLVSIAEAFVTETLRAIAEPWANGNEAQVKAAWTAQLDKELSGWADFPNTYKNRLAVRPGDAEWARMHGYTDARNAIAHGLGKLTPRQRNPGTFLKLASVGITRTIDNHLELDEQAVVATALACRQFIEHLDLTVTRVYRNTH